MSVRAPVLHFSGAGMLLEFWVNEKRLFTNLHWNHHLRFLDDQLVVDGAVFARWELGAAVRAVFPPDYFGDGSSAESASE